MVYMFSFLFSVFSVSILQGVVDFLPSIFQKMILAYTDQEYISEINDINATMTGIYFKIAKQVYINLMVVLLIKNRGFIKEGFYADVVLVDLNDPWKIQKANIAYKCGWSPLEGSVFKSRVTHTLVNGSVVYQKSKLTNKGNAERLIFDTE